MADTTGLRLILKDDTTIENGIAGYSQGFLWLYFRGYTMQEAASIFLDASKTEKIVFAYGEKQDIYEGYINCTHIMIDMDGNLSICLTRSNV